MSAVRRKNQFAVTNSAPSSPAVFNCAAAQTINQLGRLDVLVNRAGLSVPRMDPSDVARCCVYLATEASRDITGQVFLPTGSVMVCEFVQLGAYPAFAAQAAQNEMA